MNAVVLYTFLLVGVLDALSLRPEEDRFVRRAYDLFDGVKKGTVNSGNISKILPELGKSVTDAQRDLLIKDYGIDKNNLVEAIRQYIKLIQDFSLQLFLLYDKENKGYVTTSAMRRFILAVEDKSTENEIWETVAEFKPASGRIKLEKFKEVMQIK